MSLDLDRKVFGRDTILLPTDEERQLNGWLSKLNRKRKKLLKKIPVVKSVYKKFRKTGLGKKLRRFESKNRKGLKKLGAVAALAVGGYFAGPSVLKWAKAAGGKVLSSSAAKQIGSLALKQAIGKKMSAQQQAQLQAEMQQLAMHDPAAVMADPRVQEIAAMMAAQQGAVTATKIGQSRSASAALAVEGAQEVSHQAQKVAKNPTQEMLLKVGLTIIGAIVASKIL